MIPARVSAFRWPLALAGICLLAWGLNMVPLISAAPTASPGLQTPTPSFPLQGQWYTYANGDDVLVLALEGDVLWAGTRAGGVVRWNTTDGTFVQFLKPQDGLAGNTVRDIYIDPDGNKWFATDYGISVLDDQGTPDKHDDLWYTLTRATTAGNLPSDRVAAIAADAAGYLWIGTQQYWDPETAAYVGGGVSQLDPHGTPDPADDEWILTYTLANTLKVRQNQWILGLASDNVVDILPVAGNRVWIATGRHWLWQQFTNNSPGRWVQVHGGLSRLDHAGTRTQEDDQWQSWTCEDSGDFSCVVRWLRLDPYGYIWASTVGRGVLVFPHWIEEFLPATYTRFTTADGLASNFVEAIAFGPADDPEWQNTVWLSTYQNIRGVGNGVSVLDHAGTILDQRDDTWNQKNPVLNAPLTRAEGLASDRVQALVAGAGKIWMGTGGLHGLAYGISPYDLAKRAFDEPLATARVGLATNYITEIAVGPADTVWENQVWVATGSRWERKYGAGVFLLDTHGTVDPEDDTWTQFTRQSTDDDGRYPWTGLASDNVLAIAIDGDHVWFGGREATWDADRRSYTDGGLSVYDGERWTLRTVENTGGSANGLRSNSVADLALGCRGELWIALSNLAENTGAGLDRLTTGPDVHRLEDDLWAPPFQAPPLPSDLVTQIHSDCIREQVWASTAPRFTGASIRGGGLGRFDYQTESWMAYTKADGIQSYSETGVTGELRSVTVGLDGTVWAGTWGTANMSRSDVIQEWPYVPAVINWLRDGTWSYRVFEQDGWVSSVVVDTTGMVWVGTSRGGLDIDQDGRPEDHEASKSPGGIKRTWDGTQWESLTAAQSPLPAGDIEVMVAGAEGEVWIGTNGWGLIHFQPARQTTPTPTSTVTPWTPSPTFTPLATATATSTLTPVLPSPTSTATPAPTQMPHFQRYLPFLARNALRSWGLGPTETPDQPAAPTKTATPTRAPTETPTPVADVPVFLCSDWCNPGSGPGMRRQVVLASVPVDDWRMYMSGLFIGVLAEETPLRAVVEAPENRRVRVEALFGAEWLPACDSVVECARPTAGAP